MKNRLEGLHSLRAWAALSIVIFHVAGISKLPLPEEMQFIHRYLGQGVPLFFVISSFSLFLSTMPRVGSADWVGAYIIRRVFRIAPLFYAMVIFYSIFLPLRYRTSISLQDFALNLSFLFNFVPSKYESVVWAGWTIGVEMLFYLLVPYLLLFVTNGTRALILLTVSILVSSYFLDVYQAAQYPRGYAYKSFLGSLGIFAFGVPAYFAYKRLSSLPERAKSRAAALVLAAAALTLLLIVSFETSWIPVAGNRSHIWGVFFSLIIVSQCLKPSRIISGKTLAWLGNLSFGLYLCHPPLISLLKPIYEAFYRLPVWQGYSFLMCAALTLALLIPLAYLAGRLIEKPFMNLGERLVRARCNATIEVSKPSVRDTAELSCTSKPEVLVH